MPALLKKLVAFTPNQHQQAPPQSEQAQLPHAHHHHGEGDAQRSPSTAQPHSCNGDERTAAQEEPQAAAQPAEGPMGVTQAEPVWD